MNGRTMKTDIKLSPHFTLAELCKSGTAARRGIKNIPSEEQISNLRALCVNVLEPARKLLNAPIYVNSGFRSPELNVGVGGVGNSQHLKGQAADITLGSLSMNLKLMDVLINGEIPFDQAIFEKCDSLMRPLWIHVSYVENGGRHEFLFK